jgi:O-antigen/teichoic acid export membrane protein
VTSILTPVLETFDQFLIGVLLGPSAVAHYVVPMNLASRSQIVATALASALFPRLSRESGQIAGELTQRAGVALAYAFSALCGPAIILAEPFLRLWLGADFAAQAGPVARVLLVGAVRIAASTGTPGHYRQDPLGGSDPFYCHRLWPHHAVGPARGRPSLDVAKSCR